MDVHRCRFVPYPTSAINTLVFSHSDLSDFANEHNYNLRLAVGRANGNIEIWNPNNSNNWLQEATFYGGSGRSIEGLEWTKEPDELGPDNSVQCGTLRLFSIGYSSSVTEWSLQTGQPVRNWLGNNSEIWCIAAQPRLKYSDYSKNPSDADAWHGQDLVVGCADGTLIVLSTANQNITFRKFLSRPKTRKGRVLCITFHGRNTVVAGFADGTVRVFDLQKTNLIRTITLGSAPAGGPRDILVWAVRCLPNGDIVTGDSLGEVRVFDSQHKSQIQRLASHDADVLDIAINRTGTMITSAGMDRKTAHYQKVKGKDTFAKLFHKTYHEHDVKSMATFEGKNLNVIASGGLDTNLVLIPGKAVGEEYQYSISGLPQYPPVASSTAAGVFACWWGNEVRIWRLGWNFHKLVARIVVKGDENICDAVLSTDGALLAVVSAAGLRIFRLSLGRDRHPTAVKRLATIAGLGGKLAAFSSDSKWLAVISHSNKVKMFSTRRNAEGGLDSESFVEVGRTNRDSDVHLGGSLGNYWRTINRVGFSPDGKMLVASDISGYLDCWTVAEASPRANGNAKYGDTDSSDDDTDSDDEAAAQIDGWEWRSSEAAESLPKLDSAPIVLSFRPRTGPEDGYCLLVLTAKHSIFEFSLSAGSFTDWSRRNPTEVLPDRFKETRDRAMGSFWGTDGWWWIYGAAWVFGVDTTVDHASDADASKKRKRDLGGSGAGTAVKRREQVALVRAQEKDAVVNKAPKDDEGSGDQNGAPSAGGNENGSALPKEERERHKWFMTFKYRPILGIVPVAAAKGYPVQVALIERPVWDLNLPPRFESVHRQQR